MYYLLLILTIIAAVLLICVILVQKSKGGGLSSSFASSNQIMGVRRTNSFIEKFTWILASAIAVLAILSAYFMPNALTEVKPRTQTTATEQTAAGNYDQNAAAPAAQQAPAASAAPVATPAPATEAAPAAAPAPAELPTETPAANE